MRFVRKILLLIVTVLAAYWLAKKLVVPSMRNLFASKPVQIDETPILIKDIRSIGQLITYVSYDEVVADSTIKGRGSGLVNAFNKIAGAPLLPSPDRQLVLIGKGKILAGVNLSLLSDSSVTVTNDTVRLLLPKVEILDAILNPSDFETFVEKGAWSNPEATLVKAQARREMINRALQQNILQKADAKARAIMENFLQNMGYKHVVLL